jgi:hypothetical protein
VNPFILLVKPMIALGTLMTKMVVAVGFVATEGGEPPKPDPKLVAESAIVRVAVSPDDNMLSSMEVELPNGEFYQLSSVAREEERAPSRSIKPAHRNGRTNGSSTGRPVLVAMLESETGRSMRCNVSVTSEPGGGSGVCTTDRGESYAF